MIALLIGVSPAGFTDTALLYLVFRVEDGSVVPRGSLPVRKQGFSTPSHSLVFTMGGHQQHAALEIRIML